MIWPSTTGIESRDNDDSWYLVCLKMSFYRKDYDNPVDGMGPCHIIFEWDETWWDKIPPFDSWLIQSLNGVTHAGMKGLVDGCWWLLFKGKRWDPLNSQSTPDRIPWFPWLILPPFGNSRWFWAMDHSQPWTRSLLEAIVSIFVNPSQFASHEAMAQGFLGRDPGAIASVPIGAWPFDHHMLGWIMLNHVESCWIMLNHVESCWIMLILQVYPHVYPTFINDSYRIECHLSDIYRESLQELSALRMANCPGLGYIPAHPRGGVGVMTGDGLAIIGLRWTQYWGF